MTDLLSANKKKDISFDPYNAFDNSMENAEYNQDYTEIFPELADGKKPELIPEKKEGRKIRKYYNIAGIILLIFSLISNFLPALAIEGLYKIIKNADMANGIDTTAYSYYYNMMHYITSGSTVSTAVLIIIHVIFNTLMALVGLKLIKVKTIDLFKNSSGITVVKMIGYILTALAIQTVASEFIAILSSYFSSKGMDIISSASIVSVNAKAVILEILYCCIVAPITEELLFRGFAMKALGRVSQRFAIFMSAFLFGMCHGNVTQFIGAFLVGILLGYIDIKHNSLLPSIIVHFVLNTSSIIIKYVNMIDGQTGYFAQYVLECVIILVLIAGIASFLWMMLKDKIPYNTPAQSYRSNGMVLKTIGLDVLILFEIATMIYGMIS